MLPVLLPECSGAYVSHIQSADPQHRHQDGVGWFVGFSDGHDCACHIFRGLANRHQRGCAIWALISRQPARSA